MRSNAAKKRLRFTQIATGGYEANGVLTYSTVGLTDDGRVFQWKYGVGWLELDGYSGGSICPQTRNQHPDLND
jgi:hypothetical protein